MTDRQNRVVCTVITKSYLPYARVLATTLKEYNPDTKLYVLIIDIKDGYLKLQNEEPFSIIPLEVLGDQHTINKMSFYYNASELCCAVRPWLHQYLLQQGYLQWLFLDSDILILSSLDSVFQLLNSCEILLSPHLLDPEIQYEGRIKVEKNLLTWHGVFNGGFLGIHVGPESKKFIEWWKGKLIYHSRIAAAESESGDQTWLSLVPIYFKKVAYLLHKGTNVAYWNFDERTLKLEENGTISVDGFPLIFFHFSGFNPETIEKLSKHNNAILLSENRVIAQIAKKYSLLLMDAGYQSSLNQTYDFDRFETGEKISPEFRALYHSALITGELEKINPFSSYEILKKRAMKKYGLLLKKILKLGKLSVNKILHFFSKSVYPR